MTMRKTTHLIVMLLACVFTSNAQSVILTPLPTGPLPTCTEIVTGTTITFERGLPTCDQNVIITRGGTSGLITVSDIIATFPEDMSTFSYQFDSEGEFTVYCGYPGAGDASSALLGPAVCYNVVLGTTANPIPTMGEWGIIISLFLLSIIGVLYIRQRAGLLLPS